MMLNFFHALILTAFFAAPQESDYYIIETLPTPPGVAFEVSGMDTLPDGRVAVSLRNGELWIIDGIDGKDLTSITCKRIAEALFEPLGVLYHDSALYVAQRSELSALYDHDGDDIIDEYRTVCDGWGITGNYHEYAYGPVLDREGNFWVTLNQTIGKAETATNDWRGWGVSIRPDGTLVPECAGMRSPCGVGANAVGDLFYTDQQGNWVPAGSLHHLRRGAFYGHVDALRSCALPGSPIPPVSGKVPSQIPITGAIQEFPLLQLPAVWFPYKKAGMSATGILCDTAGGAFGPYGDQLFVGDFTTASLLRVGLEEVNGAYQGFCIAFRDDFQSAVLRMAWTQGGRMLVGESNRGWNSEGRASYGLERVSWTGRQPFEIDRVSARPNGFKMSFTAAADPASLTPASFSVKSYTYLYHAAYGSDEIDTKPLVITAVEAAPDGRSAMLSISDLRPGYVHEIAAKDVRDTSANGLLHPTVYYTLNSVPAD